MSETIAKSSFAAIAERYQVAEPECGWEEHDRRVAEVRAIEARRAIPPVDVVAKLESLGVPRKLHAGIAGKRDVTKALDGMRSFSKSDKSIVVLTGDPGCGKTLAASTWLLYAKRNSRYRAFPRRLITARAFCRISGFDSDGFDAIAKAECLVLDDLGREHSDKRSYFAGVLSDLLSERHGSMLPTVITTNDPMSLIEKNYGPALASRLNEAMLIQLRGEPDLRKRPA